MQRIYISRINVFYLAASIQRKQCIHGFAAWIFLKLNRFREVHAATFCSTSAQIMSEHYCELLILDKAVTKEVNPSLISAPSTCLDFFRFLHCPRTAEYTKNNDLSLSWRTGRATAQSTVP